MVITVKLWGQLRNLAGEEIVPLELPADSTITDAVKKLAEVSSEKLSSLLLIDGGSCRRSTLVFINDVQMSWDTLAHLNDGATVTLMSPIAGG